MITCEQGKDGPSGIAASRHLYFHPEEGRKQHPQLHRNTPETVGCFAVWLAVRLLPIAPITAATSYHTTRARHSKQGNAPLQSPGPLLHQLGSRVSSIVFFSLADEANGSGTSIILIARLSD